MTDVLLVTCSALPDGEIGGSLLVEELPARGVSASWARSVELVTSLVNTATVLEWNTDKVYLLDLVTSGLPVVPTVSADDHAGLAAAVASFETAVVKPRVGAGGRGVALGGLEPGLGPWVVQPLVTSISTEGETSVFVFGGEPVSAVRKLPARGEISELEVTEPGLYLDLVPGNAKPFAAAMAALVEGRRAADHASS